MKVTITSFIGLRTIKTVIAVIISALSMKYLFDQNPFFACIGATVAVERTMSHSVKASIVRNIGTVTGGGIGIIVSYLTQNIALLSLGLIPMIYVNNHLKKKESIIPGAIVYFAVVYLNTNDTAADYGIHRILGTLFGSFVGLAVNLLIFPPKQDETEEEEEPLAE